MTTNPTNPSVREALKTIAIRICQPCLDGIGAECHTAGCALFLHRVDLPIHPGLYEIMPDAPDPSPGWRPIAQEEFETLGRAYLHALNDPGHYTPRGENYGEALGSWQKRAMGIAFAKYTALPAAPSGEVSALPRASIASVPVTEGFLDLCEQVCGIAECVSGITPEAEQAIESVRGQLAEMRRAK